MGLLRRRAAVLGLLASVLLVFVGLITTVGLTSTDDTSADAAVDPLPPEVPRRDLPKVLDGAVLDSARVGNFVVVAGDFTSIRRSNGTVVGATGVFAYHIDSGELLESSNHNCFGRATFPRFSRSRRLDPIRCSWAASSELSTTTHTND